MYEKKKQPVHTPTYKIEFCSSVHNLIITFRRYTNKLVNKYSQCLYANKLSSFKTGNSIMLYFYIWMKKKWDGPEWIMYMYISKNHLMQYVTISMLEVLNNVKKYLCLKCFKTIQQNDRRNNITENWSKHFIHCNMGMP